MRFIRSLAAAVVAVALPSLACESCTRPERDVVLTRNVRRMQPDAQNATSLPSGPLSWGQLNVLHTTDTHGWLEGHIKEKNYGADWGDYVSFVKDMRQQADDLGVDLLLVDTGDLHDGAGLSDATSLNGELSNPIFENLDYDLLSIGNHELYLSSIAYETFNQFSKVYGDKYLTSNVQIINPATGQYEYIGQTHRYFTTKQGLRIMAFGVLYDFTGNSNVSRVIKAADMVKQPWFLNAVNTTEPVDLFMLIGHNPVRPTVSSSTFKTVFNAIRAAKPDTPVQIFGGHTHIRDFAVYDDKTTALESGRYCETLGWLAMSGIKTGANYTGEVSPCGVPNPTTKAIKVGNSTSMASSGLASSTSSSELTYFRRYLDWNRQTFEFHAEGSQSHTFDVQQGKAVTAEIDATRNVLNLTSLYGCAPATWCQSCAPFGSSGNIFSLLSTALSATVINQTRSTIPRLIILNTGSVRFDLVKGPFTYDDSFIVNPFTDAFQYLPNVSYTMASQVAGILNKGSYLKRDLESRDFGFIQSNPSLPDDCVDPPVSHDHLNTKRSYPGGRIIRRQSTANTPGYTTSDDFGTDGDDTPHVAIPYYSQPNVFQANASFPADGSKPATIDLVFLDYIAPNVVAALNSLGGQYTTSQVTYYLPESYTTNSYLPQYAQMAWQANVPNCPIGQGIGYNSSS